MLLQLQCYNLEAHYKKGKDMYIADHFSQAPTTATDGDEFEVFTVYQRNTQTEGLDCSPSSPLYKGLCQEEPGDYSPLQQCCLT